jgi:hypothetical protein
MTVARALSAAVLLTFTAYSLWVIERYGLSGFVGWVFHNPATVQARAVDEPQHRAAGP